MAGALVLPGVASAATITKWNTDNVLVGPEDTDPNDDVGGASVIYDQNKNETTGEFPTGAETNGQITYIAPESNEPGVKVVQEVYGGDDKDLFDGCIMASSTATCTSPFQSGKRIKQQVTDTGTIDLVFDVEADETGEESIYQVFHRLINVTEGMLGGFEVSLGVGVGSDFIESGENDGLRFATTTDGVKFGPDEVAAFSQFPFGLFGGDPLNPNPLNLPGFFDTEERAGFNVVLGEDVIQSDGFYGTYDNLFGSWLSQDMVPNGLLYDYEEGKDPLVMAWAREDGWEFLRCTETLTNGCIPPLGQVPALGVGPLESVFFEFDQNNEDGISAEMFDYIAKNLVDINGNPLGFEEGEDAFKPFLLVDAIEDLANLNLTFAIALNDMFATNNSSFTLRVTTYDVNPIPLPAAAPLLIAGLGALGFAARRRRKAA